MSTDSFHVGLTGLAVMGQNLARNIGRRGFPIAVHNRTPEKTDAFIADFGDEGTFVGARTLPEFVEALQRPRSIIIMVKAGAPVDAVIEELIPLLDEGDLIIDCGNSFYTDTERRIKEVEGHGLRYLGVGVSGGEEGALNGPSIMPGGSVDAYENVEEIFTAISAKANGKDCCAFVGPGASGHYVKMVHNGIEYADMQLIAEAYDLLSRGLGLDNDRLAQIFREWNEGDLDSFLIDITAQIFSTKDDLTDGFLVDHVLDKAEQKGTGRWTAESALALGVPATVITDAVYCRALSSQKSEREAASEVLSGPEVNFEGKGEDFVEKVRLALYASKIVAYAQGCAQLSAASKEFDWNLDLGKIASLWRGGCIIRAQFLDRISEAYADTPTLTNLMIAPSFAASLKNAQSAWREVVAEATHAGIAVPAFSAALAYYDGYRTARLPANLIQAQRDFFGAHTYERDDREGKFHSKWG